MCVRVAPVAAERRGPACSTQENASRQIRLLALVGEPRNLHLPLLEHLGEGRAVRPEELLELDLELLGQLRVARVVAVLGLLGGATLDLLVLRVLVRRAEEGAHVLERDARPLGEVAFLYDEQLLRAVGVEPRLELQRVPGEVRGAGEGLEPGRGCG